jgi:D-3-phosphoglycerate dehydrogenase
VPHFGQVRLVPHSAFTIGEKSPVEIEKAAVPTLADRIAGRALPHGFAAVKSQAHPAGRALFQTRGRTFGVVGLGRIGAATARKAAGLGYDVIGHDALVEPGTTHHGVPTVTLDELCARADVVSLHVPLTPETRGLIGADQLALMRDTTIVVNTARGGVVDVPALVDALAAGRLGGAGIDTHEDEPLPVDHPLTRFDNVVLTPHLAWYTEESYGELKRRTIENVVEVLAGRTPRDIVNPQALGVGRTAMTHDLQHHTAGGIR